MSKDVLIRPARSNEYDVLGELMFDAIHNGPTQYTKAQSKAWAPTPKRGAEWAARLNKQHVILAERGSDVLGFMSIEPGGYIDFAYIRPRAQGRGLFRELFDAIVVQASVQGDTELSTHASLMAQPAFAAMGFTIDYHEKVTANGQSLPRARMIKPL